MNELDNLKMELRDAKDELEKITIKPESNSYEEYTDVSKAYKLKDKIAYLKNQIKTYTQRTQAESEEAIRENKTPKYDYTSAGKTQTSSNTTIAAKYNTQKIFGMNKLNQTIITISGLKRKFKKLWIKANTSNEKTQEQVEFELNRIFR